MRIGLIAYGEGAMGPHLYRSLIEGLRKQGYIEGRNLIVERRYAMLTSRGSLRFFAGGTVDSSPKIRRGPPGGCNRPLFAGGHRRDCLQDAPQSDLDWLE